MNMACMLCGGNALDQLEIIRTSDLIRLCKKSLGLNVQHLFKTREIFLHRCRTCALKFFDPPVTGDELFYNALQEFDWYYLEMKAEYRYAGGFVGASDRVLDVGCGKGAFAKAIRSSKYTGLDSSNRAQRAAEANGIAIYRETIEEHVRMHAGRYDVVCAFQVLEHVADAQSFLNASVGCLRNGGLLILSVPSDHGYLSLATNAITNLPPHHVSRWNDAALNSVASLFGLVLEHCVHEALSEIHVSFYKQTMLASIMKQMVAQDIRTVDMRKTARLLESVAGKLARIVPLRWIVKGTPEGHTVTAVFRKQ